MLAVAYNIDSLQASQVVCCCLPFSSPADAFDALARRMALPQTASLALGGPLGVEGTDGGRAWFEAFEDDGSLIQVALALPSCGLRSRQWLQPKAQG